MLQNDKNSFEEEQTDDFLYFQEDDELTGEETQRLTEADDRTGKKSWKILIVDDEIEVHNVTKLALRDFTFEENPLTFISAFSAQEAKQLIQTHPDTAIILLDVVMETEDAGLQLVKYIREELNNQLVRIIVRTGQPGCAPEDLVVIDYGIDDYKTKTELTSKKLFITVITALRAFSTLNKLFEQSLQSLQSSQFPLVPQTKIEALSQLIVEAAQEVDSSANQADTFHTMSVITRIARMVLRVTDEHFAKLGISQTKLAVLIYLNSRPELSASPSSLAEHCGVSRAAMTGLLDSLEHEGYVERDTNPVDRRALMIKLNSKGQQFLDGMIPQDQYQLSELMDKLSEVERKKLIELAVKTAKLVEQQT